MSIELHIDELVLHGVAQQDREALVSALHDALVTNLAQADRSGPLAARDVAQPEYATVHVPANAQPGILGGHVGRALSEVVTK